MLALHCICSPRETILAKLYISEIEMFKMFPGGIVKCYGKAKGLEQVIRDHIQMEMLS